MQVSTLAFQSIFSVDYCELLLAEKHYFCATLCLMQLKPPQPKALAGPQSRSKEGRSSSSENSAALNEGVLEFVYVAKDFEVFYKRMFFGENYKSPMTVTMMALDPLHPIGLKVNTYSPTVSKTKGMFLPVDPNTWKQSVEEVELESPGASNHSRQERGIHDFLNSLNWYSIVEVFDMETVGEFYTCEPEFLRPRLANGHNIVFRSLDTYFTLWSSESSLV